MVLQSRLDGLARTLCSNYRKGYSHMSEFVPHIAKNGIEFDHQAALNSADIVSPGNPRFYTPRECARLMGFPESFSVSDVTKSKHRLYHQLGNAVVPPVIHAIMPQVLQTGIIFGLSEEQES